MRVTRPSFWGWLKALFGGGAKRPASREQMLGAQEQRVLAEFCKHFKLPFRDLNLLKLALTHRSYLSVTGQSPRESNERLEFLGDSVLGLVTSEFLYRRHPDEHEGHLTKVKSLLVSKAILSRRALRMGLGRFVLMSHSEVESGGRQRLSILADAFESVLGAIYLDQGFEAARTFIHQHLLVESDAISSDKRHTNYKSHLQEYVQNTFRTHPSYRIRSEEGPDHSKYFVVEVMVGRRSLGEGRGHNKKEAEQAAARDALEKVERLRRETRDDRDRDTDEGRDEREETVVEERRPRRERAERVERTREPEPEVEVAVTEEPSDDGYESEREDGGRRRRRRRGGRRRGGAEDGTSEPSVRESREVVAEPVASSAVEESVESDAFLEAVRDEMQATTPDIEADLADESEPPVVEAPLAAKAPSPAAAPAPVAFGRGRRRPTSVASAATTAPSAPVASEPVVEPVEADEPAPPPVVDVPSDEPEDRESDAERDARIQEMESALENFGRRRSADYGRRGRRR